MDTQLQHAIDDEPKRIFFLTGKPRTGKSTMIKKVVDALGQELCGGFYTEEIRDDHNRTGFNCISLEGEARQIADVNGNSTTRIGRYSIDIDAFEKVALASVENSLSAKQVTVIDEIGFMQMLSAPFQQCIERLIADPVSIILGTVPIDSHPLIDKIKLLPQVKIFMLTEQNRDFMTEAVVHDMLEALERRTNAILPDIKDFPTS